MNSNLEMIGWKCLGCLKTSRKSLKPWWDSGIQVQIMRSKGTKRQPTPVFLPGKSHGQRSLVDYSPWGPKESDMTELHFTSLNEFRYTGYFWFSIFC